MRTATVPGFPLPLRNALAELAIAAHDDEAAGAALAWLADPAGAPPPAAAARLAAVHLIDPGGTVLLAVHAPHAARVAPHAASALRAVRAVRGAPGEPATQRACHVAAALWSERLFFEVHEVLEVVWREEAGDRRLALQGVIQVAVAFHHLAHGNLRGARTLLREGRERLAATAHALPRIDTRQLLDDTGVWEAKLRGSAPPPDSEPPALALR
jgi:hypothetical protein